MSMPHTLTELPAEIQWRSRIELDPMSHAAQVFSGLTPEECRKVMSLNAAKVYSIPLAWALAK